MSPTDAQTVKIKGTVYPGVFDGEYQVTLSVSGREININVSDDFVETSAPPTREGVEGFLKVNIVGKTQDDKFILALPGEVQGAPSRVTAERGILQQVA